MPKIVLKGQTIVAKDIHPNAASVCSLLSGGTSNGANFIENIVFIGFSFSLGNLKRILEN